MLLPVIIRADAEGHLWASVPDLPGVEASGSELGRTLTRIHLKIEGRVSEILISGDELPQESSLQEVSQRAGNQDAECYEIHVNLTHLSAVAKHQSGK